MRKYRFLLGVVLFLLVCQLSGTTSSHAFADSGPPSAFLTMSGINNLEDDASQWSIYHDQGYTQGTLQNVDIQNVNTLKVTLLHSSQDYADIHAYRNLPAVTNATQFSMDVSFYYPYERQVQALEFTMDSWVNNVRWEWALQWQAVPSGKTTQASPKGWRVWTGSTWQDIQVTQDLQNNTWHTLHLYGNIVNGQVHYVGFNCDDVYTDMSQYTFAPVASSGNKLAVGVQLDGNYDEQSYPVYYNAVNLHYQ